MMEFYIDSKSGDYLEFYCSKHHAKCHLAYKGLDPAVPLLELTCPTCKEPHQFKLDRPFTSGFGPKDKKIRTRRT